MSLPFTEDFAGAAAALTGSWTQQYVRAVKRNGSGLGITDVGGGGSALVSGESPNADQYAKMVYKSGQNGVLYQAPLVRGSGSGAGNDTSYYAAFVDGANLSLQKVILEVGSELTGSPIVLAFADGDVIAISAIGTTITAYKNGVAQIIATDSAISAAGKFGIAFYVASGATPPSFDNFEGGNGSGVGDASANRLIGSPTINSLVNKGLVSC